MRNWDELSRRQQRRWLSPCCGSPKPWKHAVECPTVAPVLRAGYSRQLVIVLTLYSQLPELVAAKSQVTESSP